MDNFYDADSAFETKDNSITDEQTLNNIADCYNHVSLFFELSVKKEQGRYLIEKRYKDSVNESTKSQIQINKSKIADEDVSFFENYGLKVSDRNIISNEKAEYIVRTMNFTDELKEAVKHIRDSYQENDIEAQPKPESSPHQGKGTGTGQGEEDAKPVEARKIETNQEEPEPEKNEIKRHLLIIEVDDFELKPDLTEEKEIIKKKEQDKEDNISLESKKNKLSEMEKLAKYYPHLNGSDLLNDLDSFRHHNYIHKTLDEINLKNGSTLIVDNRSKTVATYSKRNKDTDLKTEIALTISIIKERKMKNIKIEGTDQYVSEAFKQAMKNDVSVKPINKEQQELFRKIKEDMKQEELINKQSSEKQNVGVISEENSKRKMTL